MPLEVRYRPTIRRLLERIMGEGAANRIASVNIGKISEMSGVSRPTIYYWIEADSDDPDKWLRTYNPEVARRLELFFSELLGEEIAIVERMEMRRSPKFEEMAIVR